MDDDEIKIIEVKNLVKAFGDFRAVDDISFDVSKGEIFGFLGANGAGKTTAMKILCGLLLPTSGQVRVAGFDLYIQREAIKQNIGYMSQKFSLYDDLTPEENIDFFGGIYGLSKDLIKIKKTEIFDKIEFKPDKKTTVSSLPLGWKQKLSFSLALIHNPKIVFLDEPTGGVDPRTRRQFWDLIYEATEKGTTVFITTHYMDEAEYCKRLCIMVDGRIAALGSPGEIKSRLNAKDMDEVFYKMARGAKRKDG